MSWIQEKGTYPTPRGDNALAYDTTRNEMVYVTYTSGFRVTTWRRKGTAWSQFSPALLAPRDRVGHRMVYDQARREIVLWGGMDYMPFYDMWTFDGTKWTLKNAGGPPGTIGHAMAYDVGRQRTVHFGGVWGAPFVPTGQTWEWDGKSWSKQKVSAAPSPRRNHAMAYDSTRKEIVLFGGTGAKTLQSDTWTWNGKVWKKHTPTVSPAAREFHSMAFDAKRQVIVLFGGLASGSTYLSDTWTWNGKNWSLQKVKISPSARFQHSMEYDPIRQDILLIGGRTNQSSGGFSWSWTRVQTSSASVYGAGCGMSPGLRLSPAFGSLPNLGDRFVVEVTGLPAVTSAGVLALGFSRSTFGSIRLPLDLSPMGMRGCNLYSSSDIQFVFTTHKGLGSYPLQIPYVGELKGTKAYLQAFGSDRAATKLGLVSSNGLELTIGNR